ncbi:hypothetical protein OSB04_023979 [Centaurea solstitialis]|uniref:Uncharacterized protein n=1 Tax=Centaurea solstitialis TaxID=347529 RepID=A0AA38T3Q3_9ASTR|nr:hypothetical protein OSB04_023979 [Centaurea solstitialis]
MDHSGVPPSLWAKAIATACFNQNRTMIVKRTGKTAYKMINKPKPKCKFDVPAIGEHEVSRTSRTYVYIDDMLAKSEKSINHIEHLKQSLDILKNTR